MSNSSLQIFFICAFTFGILCPLVILSGTTNYFHFKNTTVIKKPRKNVFSLSENITTCSKRRKMEHLKSQLKVNRRGHVHLKEITESACFVVNSSETGINSILHRSNFEDFKCMPVQKRFLNVTPEQEVMTVLASIPGSGNTWVRHLLEEITGIYTGSIYGSRRISGTFKGEHTIHNVSVVKAHIIDRSYDRAVIVLRDPFDSSLADFNRRQAGKTKFLAASKFDKEAFNQFLKEALNNNPVVRWVEKFKGDLFVLYYEKLMTDLSNSLIKLVNFLNYKLTLGRLWCTVVNQEGSYKRKGGRPEYMSREVLTNDTTNRKIQQWKQDVQNALKLRTIPWFSN